MHMTPLTTDPTESELFDKDWFDTHEAYTRMKEEVQDRLEHAPGRLSGARLIRLLLYIEARAQREYGWVI